MYGSSNTSVLVTSGESDWDSESELATLQTSKGDTVVITADELPSISKSISPTDTASDISNDFGASGPPFSSNVTGTSFDDLTPLIFENPKKQKVELSNQIARTEMQNPRDGRTFSMPPRDRKSSYLERTQLSPTDATTSLETTEADIAEYSPQGMRRATTAVGAGAAVSRNQAYSMPQPDHDTYYYQHRRATQALHGNQQQQQQQQAHAQYYGGGPGHQEQMRRGSMNLGYGHHPYMQPGMDHTGAVVAGPDGYLARRATLSPSDASDGADGRRYSGVPLVRQQDTASFYFGNNPNGSQRHSEM